MLIESKKMRFLGRFNSLILVSLLVAIVLFIATFFSGPSVRSPYSPSAPATFPHSSTVNNDCGDWFIVRPTRVQINRLNPDPITNANQVSVFAVITDGEGRQQELNFLPQPVHLEQPSLISVGQTAIAIDVTQSNREFLLSFVIVDRDDQNLPADAGLQLLNAAAQFVGNVADIGGPLNDFIVGFGIDQTAKVITANDLIGDLTYQIGGEYGWHTGKYSNVQTVNGAASLDFEITWLPGCLSTFNYAQSYLDTQAGIFQVSDSRISNCTATSPPSRLKIGDFAVVAVLEGKNSFFRPRPVQVDGEGIRYANGHIVRINNGPQCDGSIMYWEVMDRWGNVGWMAESRILPDSNDGAYLLSPIGSNA